MSSIALITTCKGRLHHLRETLPLMAAQGADEVVVVDYGCPDGAGDWVEHEFPGVRVVRLTDDPGFCLPRARNAGARASSSEWLAFVDADVKLLPGWIGWLRGHLEDGRFYRASAVAGVRDLETFGSVVCPRRAFETIGGYDDAMRGWGGEDVDLYTRLSQIGLADTDYPASLVDVIRHGDDQRTRWYEIKDRRLQDVVSHCYLAAKSQLLAFRGPGQPLELEVRARLIEQTRRQLAAWNGDESEPLPVLKYTMAGGGWLPPPFVMRRQVQFTIRVERRRDVKPAR
ncbi:glycosyltransferase [Quisquiliibacterium transsilvanicum]|uniref:Glycosyltransferase n=1 Tax=Quisquiliibacterium transsilvanicum TaxID=1549638 RepID=A0A7W8HID6_9BURK|nr:hypothetical protein [Quisquiliibacterium transsilvanicum]